MRRLLISRVEQDEHVATGSVVTAGSFMPTHSELKARTRRLDPFYHSLDADVHSQLVYRDSDSLRKQAAAIPEFLPSGADLRKRLLAEADALDARAKTRSREQTEKEMAFGSLYTTSENSFMNRWNAFRAEVEALPDFTVPWPPMAWPYAEWSKMEAFESEFYRLREQFEALGHQPTAPKPPTQEEVDQEHEGEGFFPSIPWRGILVVGGIAATAYAVSQVTRFIPTPKEATK